MPPTIEPNTSVRPRRPSGAALSPDAGAPLDERPQYRYAGDGRFLPANEAAREECRRWNHYAASWNARTAHHSVAP